MRCKQYPGSFDPITNGHLDIIERASRVYDKLVVGVLSNASKTPLFSAEKRVEMIRLVTKHLNNVEVDTFTGLLVDFAASKNATVIVKGLRTVADFEYEFQMALANKKLYDQAETIFLTACTENMYLSSSVVKQIAAFNGDIRHFVPDVLHDEILQRLSKELPT
ncbi:MAG TPA: pantetheine-phosphate adenylyltransferase [Ruminococcus sp.]|nr:pantetheine-phosphate adenylyltransferase [Ruminococcus sp.]